MQRLGPRHLEVLELRERRGMTYAQIAEHLEVPQSTVEALLFRARKALRREFLAVAGDGRLASLPIIGALVRRLASVRARAGEVVPTLSQLAAPVAATAMAAVISAAPFASSGAADAPVVSRPHVVTLATSVPAPSPMLAQPTLTSASPAPHVRQHLVARAAPAPGVTTMSSTEARNNAATMPVLADLGKIGAGIDPTEPLGWLQPDQEDR
jgi:hypothetical protein